MHLPVSPAAHHLPSSDSADNFSERYFLMSQNIRDNCITITLQCIISHQDDLDKLFTVN